MAPSAAAVVWCTGDLPTTPERGGNYRRRVVGHVTGVCVALHVDGRVQCDVGDVGDVGDVCTPALL